jgi:glyoxylase-like metal-dependent hydrolase (beta-lactamase superfamily II)
MESLEKVRREVPDDVLVLPAHGDCFRGLHARIDSLVAGQERANDRLLAALAEPRRAVDVFGALFSRPISESSPALLGMATGESLACLNHLMHAGLAERSIDGEGIAWYRAIPGAAAIG